MYCNSLKQKHLLFHLFWAFNWKCRWKILLPARNELVRFTNPLATRHSLQLGNLTMMRLPSQLEWDWYGFWCKLNSDLSLNRENASNPNSYQNTQKHIETNIFQKKLGVHHYEIIMRHYKNDLFKGYLLKSWFEWNMGLAQQVGEDNRHIMIGECHTLSIFLKWFLRQIWHTIVQMKQT